MAPQRIAQNCARIAQNCARIAPELRAHRAQRRLEMVDHADELRALQSLQLAALLQLRRRRAAARPAAVGGGGGLWVFFHQR